MSSTFFPDHLRSIAVYVPPATSRVPPADGVNRSVTGRVPLALSTAATPPRPLLERQVRSFGPVPQRPQYAPHDRSPLRQVSLAPRPPAELLRLGDARLLSEGNAERAVYYWLAAELGGERETMFEELCARAATGRVPLNLFHLAHLAPTAQFARQALCAAVQRDPDVLQLMERLLQRAGRHALFSQLHVELGRNFAALLPAPTAAQVSLLTSLRERRWDAARALARGLCERLPHLLAPHCALFVCDLEQGGGGPAPGAFAEGWNATYAAGEILRFVLTLDADAHVQAMGALREEGHRWIWGAFLERFYQAAPEFFVGNIGAGEEPGSLPISRRRLCGLGWLEAHALPLPRGWREQVVHCEKQKLRGSAPA